MRLPPFVPKPVDLTREVLIVVGGALIAAFIMSHWTWGKTYIRDAWKP